MQLQGAESSQLFLGIQIEDGHLICALYQGTSSESPYQTVIFADFDSRATEWAHITCQFDGSGAQELTVDAESTSTAGAMPETDASKNVLQGSLYQDGYDYRYYSDQS